MRSQREAFGLRPIYRRFSKSASFDVERLCPLSVRQKPRYIARTKRCRALLEPVPSQDRTSPPVGGIRAHLSQITVRAHFLFNQLLIRLDFLPIRPIA